MTVAIQATAPKRRLTATQLGMTATVIGTPFFCVESLGRIGSEDWVQLDLGNFMQVSTSDGSLHQRRELRALEPKAGWRRHATAQWAIRSSAARTRH